MPPRKRLSLKGKLHILIFSLGLLFVPMQVYASGKWLSKNQFFAECGAMNGIAPQFCTCAHEKVFLPAIDRGIEDAKKVLAFKGQPIEAMNEHLQNDPAVTDARIEEICGIADEYISLLGTSAERSVVDKAYRRVSAEIVKKVKAYGFDATSATYINSPQTYCYHVQEFEKERESIQANIDMFESGHVRDDTRRIVFRAKRVCN